MFSGGWLLNGIYQLSSGYSDSIWLPTVWLIRLFAAGIAVFAHAPLCAGKPMLLQLAVRLGLLSFCLINAR